MVVPAERGVGYYKTVDVRWRWLSQRELGQRENICGRFRRGIQRTRSAPSCVPPGKLISVGICSSHAFK